MSWLNNNNDVDWYSDVLDLRDIVTVWQDLKERKRNSAECRSCDKSIELVAKNNAYQHVGGGLLCYPHGEQAEERAWPYDEPLDEDEETLLQEINDLDAELGNDLDGYSRNEPTLVNETYWEDYAKGYLEETQEIPDFLKFYIDWKSWAEDFRNDYTEVRVSHQVFYIRAY